MWISPQSDMKMHQGNIKIWCSFKIWFPPQSSQKMSFPPQGNLKMWISLQSYLKMQFPPQISLKMWIFRQNYLKMHFSPQSSLKMWFPPQTNLELWISTQSNLEIEFVLRDVFKTFSNSIKFCPIFKKFCPLKAYQNPQNLVRTFPLVLLCSGVPVRLVWN